MATTPPRVESKGLGVRQQALLLLMSDGRFRSALDVEDERLGFTEARARATLRSLEARSLVAATGLHVGSVRRTFGLTDAGMNAVAGLMPADWTTEADEP